MARKPVPKNIPELPTMIKGDVLLPAPDPAYVGRLTVIKGGDEGLELLLQRGTTSIGRASDSDLALTDLASSRKHAQLVWEGEVFRLVDLGSGNGTLLNGKRIKQAELRHGDIFEIGGTQIKLEMFAPSEEEYVPESPPKVAPAPRLPPSPVAQNPTVGLPGLSAQNGRGLAGAAPPPASVGPAGGGLFPSPGVLPGVLPPMAPSGTGGVIPPGQSGEGQLPGPFGQALAPQAPAPPVSAPFASGGFPPPAYAETPPPPRSAPPPSLDGPLAGGPVSSSPGGMVTMQPAAPAATPVAPPAAGSAAGPGWAVYLSSMVEGVPARGIYGALGLSALALFAAVFLLVWQPGKSDEEVAVEHFRAGLAAYVTRDWAKAEGAFQEALSLAPEFTEARQYTLLTRNEKAISARWEEARKLSSDSGAGRDQTLVALALARSIPSTSLYGEDAARLEREARQAWISSIRVEVEDLLRQRPQKLKEAAKTLLETEQILGEIPASIADLTQSLEKEAGTNNWRTLAQNVIETPPEATNSSPVEEIPVPPVEEPPTEVAAGPPPTPSEPKAPNTKAPETPAQKSTKDSVLALYKSGRFAAAIEEANRMGNKEGANLALWIDKFQKSYSKGKATFDSGGRSTAYADLKEARQQDLKISKGHYRAEINKMLAPCASAQAEYYFNTAKNRNAYGDYRLAYELAQEALSIDSSLTANQKIIEKIDALAEAKWKEEQKLEGKGKVDEAIAACEAIMAMLPSSKGLYNDAKKAKEKLLRFK